MLIDATDRDPSAATVSGAGGTDALDPLLGASRAALLRDLVRPRTTSELATRHNLAVGTVSGHLSILANARLVSAHRRGRRVYYLRTPLGSLLVDVRREGGTPSGRD
jgi:DNA-binding transcriptional ArsR family regulator